MADEWRWLENKKILDLLSMFLCSFIIGIAIFGIQDREVALAVTIFFSVIFSAFFFLFISDVLYHDQSGDLTGRLKVDAAAARPSVPEGKISRVLLMNEERHPVDAWDIFGRTALVIGRDIKENQVDIDLSKNSFAATVDIEHAVLNYVEQSWYVEDLGSKNGIVLKKAADGRSYALAADLPCKVEKGDELLIGMICLKLD